MTDTNDHTTLAQRVASVQILCAALVEAYTVYATEGMPALALPAATLEAIAEDITAVWGPEVPVREADGSFTYCGLRFDPEAS